MSSPLHRLLSTRTLMFALVAAFVAFAVTGLVGRRGASVANATAPANRAPAPNFTVTTLDGKRWSLSEQQGHVVLLNFFATWCPPCRAEMPDLASIAKTYQPKGVVTLGLSLDEGGAAAVQPFVKRYAVGYPVALAEPGNPIAAGITGIPVTMIIDKSGRVARTYVGMISPQRIRSDLDELAAEQ